MGHIRKIKSKVMNGLTRIAMAALSFCLLMISNVSTACVYAMSRPATNAVTGDIAFLIWIAILIGALIAAFLTKRKSKEEQQSNT